jgi:hypothetical protein
MSSASCREFPPWWTLLPFTQLGRFGPFVLGVLAVLNLGILWWMNRRLRLADDTPLVVIIRAMEKTKEE